MKKKLKKKKKKGTSNTIPLLCDLTVVQGQLGPKLTVNIILLTAARYNPKSKSHDIAVTHVNNLNKKPQTCPTKNKAKLSVFEVLSYFLMRQYVTLKHMESNIFFSLKYIERNIFFYLDAKKQRMQKKKGPTFYKFAHSYF